MRPGSCLRSKGAQLRPAGQLLLGKASSLTSNSLWKLFIHFNSYPHSAINLGLAGEQSVRIRITSISTGKSGSRSQSRTGRSSEGTGSS